MLWFKSGNDKIRDIIHSIVNPIFFNFKIIHGNLDKIWNSPYAIGFLFTLTAMAVRVKIPNPDITAFNDAWYGIIKSKNPIDGDKIFNKCVEYSKNNDEYNKGYQNALRVCAIYYPGHPLFKNIISLPKDLEVRSNPELLLNRYFWGIVR